MFNVLSEAELAYMAGIVDGEGTIGVFREITPKRKAEFRYRAALEVSNTDEDVIDWLQVKFGGYTNCTNERTAREKGHKLMYKWHCKVSDIGSLLKTLMPYLRIKKANAATVLQFIKIQPGPGKRTFHLQDEFYGYWAECKKLNARGRNWAAA